MFLLYIEPSTLAIVSVPSIFVCYNHFRSLCWHIKNRTFRKNFGVRKNTAQ
ncbi:hypothetical protein M23134_07534 [Microscilla marina ATCC 23134]|uniref:Uncharacterized protein n=1 Tax=Microscilla marina ATCC 23134 TaxID=313606 RepID=A1ZF24_MICM2|nr:hypothetical protein M23134_07534 [Microscilla marina ATCC 23134]